jgi:hypothetical protein
MTVPRPLVAEIALLPEVAGPAGCDQEQTPRQRGADTVADEDDPVGLAQPHALVNAVEQEPDDRTGPCPG